VARGKTPSLLTGSAGTPCVCEARRQRTCGRCKNDISRGETCVEVPTPGIHAGKRTFCRDCFKEVYSQTKEDLEAIAGEVWPETTTEGM
jgi:hypothetical protein